MMSVCFCFLNSDPATICSPFLCVSTTSGDNFVRQHPPSSTPLITSTLPSTAAASVFSVSSSSSWLSLYKSLRHRDLSNYKATVETFKVSPFSDIPQMPMFMNSGADLALEFKPRRAIFATKNVCKNLIANVQLEAMGQEQVVQKQKTVGVKKSAKISLTARFIVSNLSSWVSTKTVWGTEQWVILTTRDWGVVSYFPWTTLPSFLREFWHIN